MLHMSVYSVVQVSASAFDPSDGASCASTRSIMCDASTLKEQSRNCCKILLQAFDRRHALKCMRRQADVHALSRVEQHEQMQVHQSLPCYCSA
jgi:hypothetical protein